MELGMIADRLKWLGEEKSSVLRYSDGDEWGLELFLQV